MSTPANGTHPAADLDVIVVGGGISGLYTLWKTRQMGLRARAYEAGSGIGGTWFWNRYPGCRCDIESLEYSFSFDDALQQEWEWSERYATQPEILRYAQFVATKHGMYPHITFNTRVKDAVWDEKSKSWTVSTDTGESITCRHYVMATGCLSVPKDPDVPGTGNFTGGVYVTGRWPHEKVDFTGRRVAVIGCGGDVIFARAAAAKIRVDRLSGFLEIPDFGAQFFELRPAYGKTARLEQQAFDLWIC